MKTFLTILLAITTIASAREYHVAPTGSDKHPGTKEQPFKTISAAADVAQPGDIITVHEGVYRERVDPPRGGESDAKRITYQAAPGEKVTIEYAPLRDGRPGGSLFRARRPNGTVLETRASRGRQ